MGFIYYFRNNAIFASTTTEGDIYSSTKVNNLEIGGNAIISSTGDISTTTSGAPSILKGYKASSFELLQQLNINKAIERLQTNRAQPLTYSNGTLTTLDFTLYTPGPEGQVLKYDGPLTISLENAYKGKGTIIVTCGDITISKNLLPNDSNSVLGLIAKDGKIIIEDAVKSIGGAVFYAGKNPDIPCPYPDPGNIEIQ